MNRKILLRRLKEAITSTSLPELPQWTLPLTVLPPGVTPGLMDICRVIKTRGKRVVITTITTPTFADIAEGEVPPDATQEIRNIVIEPKEYGTKQFVSEQVVEDWGEQQLKDIEKSLRRGGLRKIDEVIINALASDENITVIYAGGKSAEADLTSEDKFTWEFLIELRMLMGARGYDLSSGEWVLLMNPKQQADLLKSIDKGFVRLAADGIGKIDDNWIEFPKLFRIRLISADVPTGSTSSGLTTYHAFLLKSVYSIALAIARDLRIQVERDIQRRGLYLVASTRVGAAVIDPNSVLRIVTT
mgnify:CR=1 FL=1